MALHTRTEVLMDTFVTIGTAHEEGVEAAVTRAFDWFRRVEAACSRFDHKSEVMHLLDRIGTPTPVSAILYEAVAFAIAVASPSGASRTTTAQAS